MQPASSDPTSLAILAKAQQGINEVMVRCHEATSYLSNREFLPAIGALAGMEDLVRSVSTLLIVLRDTEDARTRIRPN
jgi:hypothetical protein